MTILARCSCINVGASRWDCAPPSLLLSVLGEMANAGGEEGLAHPPTTPLATLFLSPLDMDELQRKMETVDMTKRIQAFIRGMGMPAAFVVIGWQRPDKTFGVISHFEKIPPMVAIQSIAWALQDLAAKLNTGSQIPPSAPPSVPIIPV